MGRIDQIERAARVLSRPAYDLMRQGLAWKQRYPRCAARFHLAIMRGMEAQRPPLWRLRRAWHRMLWRRWDARATAAGL